MTDFLKRELRLSKRFSSFSKNKSCSIPVSYTHLSEVRGTHYRGHGSARGGDGERVLRERPVVAIGVCVDGIIDIGSGCATDKVYGGCGEGRLHSVILATDYGRQTRRYIGRRAVLTVSDLDGLPGSDGDDEQSVIAGRARTLFRAAEADAPFRVRGELLGPADLDVGSSRSRRNEISLAGRQQPAVVRAREADAGG